MSMKQYDPEMKDADLRALVIEALYALRRHRDRNGPTPQRIAEEPPATGMPVEEVHRIIRQLSDYDLVKLGGKEMSGGHFRILGARLSAKGIDVAEGTTVSPITVAIHATNAQIGDGNRMGGAE